MRKPRKNTEPPRTPIEKKLRGSPPPPPPPVFFLRGGDGLGLSVFIEFSAWGRRVAGRAGPFDCDGLHALSSKFPKNNPIRP